MASYFCHENLTLKSHLVSFLSWLNILVLSLVRKFVLALQHVLGFIHLDSLSLEGLSVTERERKKERSYFLGWTWYSCHYLAVSLLAKLLCKNHVHRSPR